MEAGPSPFALIPEAEWLCASPLCFAIFDSFPVSPGHVLVITRRVVATWFDCTPDEQAALMQLVGEVRALVNTAFAPIEIEPETAADRVIIGEFTTIISAD